MSHSEWFERGSQKFSHQKFFLQSIAKWRVRCGKHLHLFCVVFIYSTGQSSSLDAVFYSISLRSLYFDRGKIKMNDISAWTRLTLSEHCFPLFVSDNYSKLDPSKSSGNFKRSPSYCCASLSEGARFDDSKYFRNLDFATTSYGCSTPKLGRKLLETTSNKIHMLTFLKSA